jgi:hypothetical protein
MTFRFRENEIESPAVVDAFKELQSIIRGLESEIRSTKRDPNFLLEGQSTERGIIRSVRFRISPGSTPGTNLTISDLSGSILDYNRPALIDGSNIAKSGSSGSYSLNAAGTIITIDLSEDIVGILGFSFATHDLNSGSTTEMYVPYVNRTTNLLLSLIKRGSINFIDWLAVIVAAGDRCEMQVAFVTST